MKFEDLDRTMRLFEESHDHCALPGLFLVARIDGRGFTTLTKETLDLEAPFDRTFRDHMISTTTHLMDCGFRVLFAYTQSDEISLLFHPAENLFNRKLRKWNSILAAEAAGVFSLKAQLPVAFDCRISQLPSKTRVMDYFRWRQEDAHKNALTSHCYWSFRKKGLDPRAATEITNNKSVREKTEILLQNGINFEEVPLWQKQGIGVQWESFLKAPTSPQGKPAHRNRLAINMELPTKEAFSAFIATLLEELSD